MIILPTLQIIIIKKDIAKLLPIYFNNILINNLKTSFFRDL